MPPIDVPWLGQRLREERVRQGVSLRGLAREVGVSASMISQIETAKSQPSVSTLYAITSALGISVEGLFTPPDPASGEAASAAVPAPVAPPGPGPGPAGDGREAAVGAREAAVRAREAAVGAGEAPAGAAVRKALGSMRGACLGRLVHPDDRRTLTLESGVTWQLLGELPGRSVDFLLVTYPPGSSSGTGGLMRHPGCEYGFLVSGELVLTLGLEETRLRAGDSLSFESTTPHSYRNDGTGPAVGVWFVLER